MTSDEIYWAEFSAATDELIAEWRAQYDPDGEMSILELIEAAQAAPTPPHQAAGERRRKDSDE